ncbi:MAG: YicC family protein [Clostridia bacterium]|nr:YicC family protein [Clostridia bacterium]
MIRSMTAFGRATGKAPGRDIIVEIKSVNNRFFDCQVKLPRLFAFLEDNVKKQIAARGIARGKVDVYITIDVTDTVGVEVDIDRTYAKSYIDALKKLSAEFDLPCDITTMRVAQNRDIFAVKKAEEDAEAEWQALLPVLNAALDAFIAARESEGENMRRDIAEKKANVKALAEKIAPLSERDKAEQYEKMKERIRDLVGESVQIDEAKLITECAVYADKIAVDEEIVRLASHFEAFDAILTAKEPVGRKLDFLMQEMNRETNTIGSKACDVEIARIVVEMKSELEKIREQIQNIE